MPRPKLREVTRLVREANAAWDGGEYCGLMRVSANGGTWKWHVAPVGAPCNPAGREWLPGDGKKLDAVAVARRLIVAWRELYP